MMSRPAGAIEGVRRRKIYIAGEDWDYIWDEAEIPDVERMWNEGFSIWQIAKACMRDPDEVLILIMDRAKQGEIQQRPGGILGGA